MQCSYAEDCRLHESIRALIFPNKTTPKGRSIPLNANKMKHILNNNKTYKKLSCPSCKSEKITKRGFFKTKAHGKQQRYFCKSCNKKFIPITPFYRMRNHPKKITLCLDLFYKGVSTRQIQEHLQAFYPHNSSNVSIYRWVIKYSKQISKLTDNIKLKVGRELQIDEVEYKTMGKKSWFIDSIDTKTRFLVSADYSETRGQKELISVLKEAKKKTEQQISIVTSDGLTSYPLAIHRSFVLKKKSNTGKFGVIHNRVNASRGEGFNIAIERFHNSLRHRTKTFRGFHGSVESAKTILQGYVIFYNFIRKHQSLKGRTPSELATNIKLENPNRWLDLINLSSSS